MNPANLEELLNQCFDERRSVVLDVRNVGRFHALVQEWDLARTRSWLHVIRLPHPLPEHGTTEKAFFVFLPDLASAEPGEQIDEGIWHALYFGTEQSGKVVPADGPREW